MSQKERLNLQILSGTKNATLVGKSFQLYVPAATCPISKIITIDIKTFLGAKLVNILIIL